MTSRLADLPDHDEERHPFQPGDVFEKYQIVNLIGRGGTAFVYHGYQEFLDRHVAIKIIPTQAAQGEEYRRRARAEATVLSRLRHPNVVQVFDAGVSEDGAFIYIVMEKLEGRPLREVLYSLGSLNVPEALLVGAQVCDAVEAAHRLNVIHRDLKPENIFVESGNHAIVLDFGIAKFLGAGYATTGRHRWQGTALYMSPEHLQGKGVSARSDIYALGTMLYEALAGGHPCLNGIDEPTIQEIAFIQVSHAAPLLTQVVPTIPDYVARIVQRAIAKAPEHRFSSMLELGTALRDAERHLTLACRDHGRFTPTVRDLVAETNNRLGNKVMAVPMAPQQSPKSPPVEESPRPSSPVSRHRGNTLRLVDGGSPPPPSVHPASASVPPVPKASVAPPPASPKHQVATVARADTRTRSSKTRTVVLGCVVGLAVAIPLGIVLSLSEKDPVSPEAPAGSESIANAAAASASEEPSAVEPIAASSAASEPEPPLAESAAVPVAPPEKSPPKPTVTAPPGVAPTAPVPPKTNEPKEPAGGLVFPEPKFGKDTGSKPPMPGSGL